MTEEQVKRKKARRKRRKIKRALILSIMVLMIVAIIFLITAIVKLIDGDGAKGEIILPVETTTQESTVWETTTQETTQETTAQETATQETTQDTTAPTAAQDESTAETTTAEQASGIVMPSERVPGSQLDASNFVNYSTEKVPYGFGAEVDEDNRPDGCTWYANKFSNYTALFIMPKSNNIYLTFDEGYEYGFSGEILDTLKEKNVKAVFFITLPYAKQNPDLVQRMIDEGHIIGNHTTTHPAGGLQQYDAQRQIDDIDQVTQYVKDNFGYEMTLFRYPEGSFREPSLAIVNALGYTPVFWSFAYKDWDVNNQPELSTSLQNALDKAHGGAIYLLHAESETNTRMLPDLIDGLRAKGYSLEQLNY